MALDTRDYIAWGKNTIVGYIALDIDGKPYQPILGNGVHSHKKPITVYKTIGKAVSYSPVGSAAQVRMLDYDAL